LSLFAEKEGLESHLSPKTNELFDTRYEEGLMLIVKGITSKGGIKKYDKVN